MPALRPCVSLAFSAVVLGACAPINPNFETLLWPNAANYMIEGALTRGFASFPRVAYVQGEGSSTDRSSFRIMGPPGAGIDARGIYVPTEILAVDQDRRFKKTFVVKSRYGMIRIFAWDDVNQNGVRDLNEALGGEWELLKQDMRGWTFNAPAWNQFNFAFAR